MWWLLIDMLSYLFHVHAYCLVTSIKIRKGPLRLWWFKKANCSYNSDEHLKNLCFATGKIHTHNYPLHQAYFYKGNLIFLYQIIIHNCLLSFRSKLAYAECRLKPPVKHLVWIRKPEWKIWFCKKSDLICTFWWHFWATNNRLICTVEF